MDLFKQYYLPAIKSKKIARFNLFTLTDDAEQNDHCDHVYHKSLLYLVSNAFEQRRREPILGMEICVLSDSELPALFRTRGCAWIRSPNKRPAGTADAATAQHHGDFDDDPATLRATLARIVQADAVTANFGFERTASSLRQRRQRLVPQTRDGS